MIRQDDRTPEQMTTHRYAVVGTDSFLSGWGEASAGASVAAWAVPGDPDWIKAVTEWVERRGDMRRVRFVDLKGYRPRCAHLRIYAVTAAHPALDSLRRLYGA